MSSKQEEIDTLEHTIQTPGKHLTIQGYYDDPEPPKDTVYTCCKIVRMVIISFILGIITGLIIHPYVMPFIKVFVD